MGNIVKTAQCRFCGQMVQIETDKKLTQPQAEEQATMTCNCTEAVEYQKEKQRKEKAMMNVSALFGENAAPDKRCGEGIVNILKAAVEEIYTGGLAKVTLNLRGGVKASISQNAKAFLEDGDIPMDNNATESALRSFCLHKHTWKLIDSLDGANASAIIYSITETAKANNLNPFRYLEHVLTVLKDHQDDREYSFINDILPWSEKLPAICRSKTKATNI